ncbi:competence protein ComGC [Bacillus thermophilus]|jgi:competence protein ComGC|uniref:ComG operon protein 3 n=1 Tax=Siminovitchia thermophila TaxID=1245522 RepID=A0ABS2R2C9_9BACI|nr:competence type IV pilus major pilin ComGC [Siminovitchia thermophila]MBM7713800.1 competence protein ComGC [Siminovitchia thermophila]ONK23669.1 competence protein ComG [Bacillus sp. VT-16-64]
MLKFFRKNQKGFTLVEMMVVLLVITVLILVALPNVTKHSSNINNKGCDALRHMVQGQVEAYRLTHQQIPSFTELQREGYVKEKDNTCPNGKTLVIDSNGEVKVSSN